MSHYWSRRADVINRGFSGYNSRWAFHVFETSVINLNPDMVVIFFGVNDAVVENAPSHVPIAAFGRNLELMILQIKKVINSQ